METYEAMRRFADSWGLLGMVIVFLGVVAFVLRPGAKRDAQDAADIPFKEYDDEPGGDAEKNGNGDR
ncbi:MAG: cbb3-type cytochrome c oxidase subunit 3 [Rhodobacteraceae bacterium]|nr:MAG: cbb3-type cytochrome c oxidase subunit 3 [Paracoccaceae bacterium]